MLTISDYWLGILLGTILPAVTALVTSRVASPGQKAVILLALSTLTGWLTTLRAAGGVFDVKTTLLGIAVTFATAVVAHFGLLKPLGVTGGSGVIASAVPGGLGGGTDPAHAGVTPAADPGAPPVQSAPGRDW